MVERPWLTHYPEGIDWNFDIAPKPLYALLDDAAELYPQNTALDFYGRRYSYAELKSLTDKAAAGFQNLGVGAGSKVGLFLPNVPHYVIAYYAILKAGGTVVNFSPLYSERELLDQVADSGVEMMVTLDLEALYPKMLSVLKQSSLKRIIVGTFPEVLPWPKNWLFPIFKRSEVAKTEWDSRHEHFHRLFEAGSTYKPLSFDPRQQVAVLQYTGGTTGTPKGAMLSHANLYVNALQSKLWFSGVRLGEERILAVLPFFHVFAMTGVLNMGIAVGGELLMLPRFELEAVMKLIAKERPSLMAGVPTMYRAFLNHPLAAQGALKSLRLCISGGAPLPVELKKTFEETSGCKLFEGYGLTESSPVAAANPVIGSNKPGSIGQPVPGTDILIVDRENPMKEMPLGEIGEIAISGPQVMLGYWNRPEATAETVVNGRLLTGDLGYMDAEGYTFIIDREKDLILVSGYNVFPRHIEEVLYEHPAVAEAIVIGVPDTYRGEAPKAFVTLKPGNEGLTAEALLIFLRERLGKHEIPREVEFRDSLPKTMVGKLSKKELIAEEKAKLAAKT
ncbi:long-chain-fatty-acid--CoA ligase [Govanella unica]|uniref:Long-chain fatty acid--CoA ligase n=1 Tax=Govanella unica TaxID=2975056 RepID=A0A9X3Z7D1_9PROT|nr:long-chain fatty acid--CoA ligase [Govania unica]MDA5194027.1 long-chain fatty acid--CoA ligase [Govania unica]